MFLWRNGKPLTLNFKIYRTLWCCFSKTYINLRLYGIANMDIITLNESAMIHGAWILMLYASKIFQCDMPLSMKIFKRLLCRSICSLSIIKAFNVIVLYDDKKQKIKRGKMHKWKKQTFALKASEKKGSSHFVHLQLVHFHVNNYYKNYGSAHTPSHSLRKRRKKKHLRSHLSARHQWTLPDVPSKYYLHNYRCN